jgi:hypothetical protein
VSPSVCALSCTGAEIAGKPKIFPIIGKLSNNFSNHWKNRPKFSNHWKIFFQSLEKSAHFFQPLEKSFPTVGKLPVGRRGGRRAKNPRTRAKNGLDGGAGVR